MVVLKSPCLFCKCSFTWKIQEHSFNAVARLFKTFVKFISRAELVEGSDKTQVSSYFVVIDPTNCGQGIPGPVVGRLNRRRATNT